MSRRLSRFAVLAAVAALIVGGKARDVERDIGLLQILASEQKFRPSSAIRWLAARSARDSARELVPPGIRWGCLTFVKAEATEKPLPSVQSFTLSIGLKARMCGGPLPYVWVSA